jgi:hypothetical protein
MKSFALGKWVLLAAAWRSFGLAESTRFTIEKSLRVTVPEPAPAPGDVMPAWEAPNGKHSTSIQPLWLASVDPPGMPSTFS